MLFNRLPRGADRARTFRPFAEVLEDRTVPTVTISPSGTTLNISSNNQADSITVRDNGDGDLQVSFSGGTFSGNNFRRINFNLRGGNDRFTYRQTGNRTRDMVVDGSMGTGNDLFTGSILGNINSNRTLDIRVFGDSGADGIDLTANADVDVASTALLRARLFGGDDKDRVDFNYQGELDGLLRYNLEGNGGDDNGAGFIRATIRADLGSSGQVGIVGDPATVDGNFGDDSVAHFVFKDPADIFLAVSAQENGGLGTDVGNRTANVTSSSVESDFVT